MAVRVCRQLVEEEFMGYVSTYLIKRMLVLPFLPCLQVYVSDIRVPILRL